MQPWVTPAILNSIKTKDRLYLLWRKSNTDSVSGAIHEQNFKIYNERLKLIISSAKALYYSTQLDKFKNDIRKTWRVIRSAINNKSNRRKFPSQFKMGDAIIEGEKSIADEFNKFFVSINSNSPNVSLNRIDNFL